MAQIAKKNTELIGRTPLFELRKIEQKHKVNATIIGKLESFNPARSVKDRLGFALIEAAQKQGLIDENTLIIEPTSGNLKKNKSSD